MRFPQTWNAWKFGMFKILHIHNYWNVFFVPEPLWNSDNQKFSNFKIDFFYRSVISHFVVQLFLLTFSFQCWTQKIGFRDSGYVIKPPQTSSALYEAPPFTEHPTKAQMSASSTGSLQTALPLNRLQSHMYYKKVVGG